MDEDAGRWMTYDEIAEARGTTRRAAVMLVRRHKWRRQKDNEGHIRALVPATWAEPTETKSSDNGSGYSDRAFEVLAATLVALQEAHARELSVLREQYATAQQRAEAAERRADEANARGDRAEAGRGEAAQQLALIRAALDQAQAEARKARDAAAELTRENNEARQARGLVARLRDAWRGRYP
jgi:hypothetical protein